MAKEHEKGRTLMWVHPLFAKKVKMDAVSEDRSILDHTKRIGMEHKEFLDNLKRRNNENKKKFDFKL